MTWTNLTFAFGSVLTSAKMTQLYDNFQAFADKDSGAPTLENSYVVEAMISANAVAQGKLKTTTGDVSTSSSVLATGPGGQYGFWPSIWTAGTAAGNYIVAPVNGNTTLSTSPTNQIYLSTPSETLNARQRYVQASPPYDLGNGEIPLFVFAIINNATGLIESSWAAQDPPWANNGPTNIRPDYEKNGKKYQCRKVISKSLITRLTDPATRQDAADEIDSLAPVEIEITQDLKQSDMPLIPHPFIGNNMTGKTLVMLDPFCRTVDLVATLMNSGGHAGELVMGNRLVIDNTPINGLITPPGVMGVSARLK